MESLKYVGLDVHQETISVAVRDGDGKLIMQSVLATRAAAILDFVQGLRGTVQITFEEGTHSAWLYDWRVSRVAKVVVCNSRKKCVAQGGQQKRSHRCAQTGGVIANGVVVSGLSRAEQHHGFA
jgi:hypothetical protein